jgi:iron-sulfur cluster assembly accessory protein
VSDTIETAPAHGVILTPNAQEKLKKAVESEGNPNLRLRMEVKAGGCAGLQYDMWLDENSDEQDLIVNYEGVEVIVDQSSALYLSGATIDFEDTLMRQGFTIDNPNATGSCACGNSFN